MTDHERMYPLPTEDIPGVELSDHLDDIAEIVRFLNSHGIETRGTRIERYGQFLARVRTGDLERADASKIFKTSGGGLFQSAEDWFLYVLREVHELMWILAGLKAHMPLGADGKLRSIVGGRDFAALDTDSASRNTQFELRIASYFCQAGCEVDLSTDTDIVAFTNDHSFFVECKRLASTSQLGKRLSEARTQLGLRMPRKDGRRLLLGCVALDVTKLAFAHNGLTWGFTNDHSRDVVRDKLLAIAEGADRLFSFESPRKLLCYWLQIHIASLIMRPTLMPISRFTSYHIPKDGLGRKEARVFKAFYDVFESVSRADYRSSQTKQFTPRNSVTFPAGTTFEVEEHHILRLLDKSPISEEDRAIVVASLNIGGNEHAFTFFEMGLLPTDSIAEWRSSSVDDQVRANLALLARLYLQRYPYEDSRQEQD